MNSITMRFNKELLFVMSSVDTDGSMTHSQSWPGYIVASVGEPSVMIKDGDVRLAGLLTNPQWLFGPSA